MKARFTPTGNATRSARLGLSMLVFIAALAPAGDAACRTPVFTPLQIALFPVAQIFRPDVPVRGIRLNLLYGDQQDVAGLDAGFINDVSERVSGLGVGVVNLSRGDADGIQLALTNKVDGRFRGVQAGPANFSEGRLRGAQVGVVNSAGDGAGFQLGVYNRASSLKGLQIGLLNLNENGFLPVFPFLNFGF
jgi:hypothetical protein